MVTYNNQRRSSDPTFPKPEVEGLLGDVPDGEPGLLPELLTRTDLKVWFTIPPFSDPMLNEEKYELFVDDQTDAIATRYWTTPIADSDRFLVLPSQWLRNSDGSHRFYYKTTIYNGAQNYSFDLVMTLDTRPPVLATNSEPDFPSDVLPPYELDADYLENNGDKVDASLPKYATPRPWDCITWYYGTTPASMEVGGVIELDDKNHADPVVLTLTGDFLRSRPDGRWYVDYSVQDRARNLSVRSESVALDVAVTPIPRSMPWPSVEEASSPGEQQTLDPMLAPRGVVVKVPDEAVFLKGERPWVQFGDPATVGACRVTDPIISGQRRFQIDMQNVSAYIGKTLTVTYGVMDKHGEQHDSTPRALQVQTLPVSRLKPVLCEGLSGGNLSYAMVGQQGARLTLEKWPLISTYHWIMITMTGVATSGQNSTHVTVAKRAVTDQEVFGGIGFDSDIRVPKAFLNTLRRRESLTGNVYVSYDSGETWPPMVAPNFPALRLTFVD